MRPVSSTVRDHLRHCTRRNLRPSTIKKRETILARLETFLELRGRTILGATLDDLRDFTDRPTQAPAAAGTEMSHLHEFYRWALEESHLIVNPSLRLERPRTQAGLPHPISDASLARALEQSTGRVRVWLHLAAYGGLRASDIAWLSADRLRLNAEPAVMGVEGKGGKMRVVPIHPVLGAVLVHANLPPHGRCFPRLDGRSGSLQPHTVSKECNLFLHDLGIPETLHSLRHWFATKTYHVTHDLLVTQELLGHANPATTRRYTWVDPGDAVRAVNLLPIL